LGGQRLTRAIRQWWGTRRWDETRWRREQAVTDGILRVVEELCRTEMLLRLSAWSEVDVQRPASRELVEENDGGASARVGHHSRRFELKAVATRRGRRGNAFAQLRRRWKGVDGGGNSKLGGDVTEQSSGERARRQNGREQLLLDFHIQDKVEGEAVH
jgi:hypothetical protein